MAAEYADSYMVFTVRVKGKLQSYKNLEKWYMKWNRYIMISHLMSLLHLIFYFPRLNYIIRSSMMITVLPLALIYIHAVFSAQGNGYLGCTNFFVVRCCHSCREAWDRAGSTYIIPIETQFYTVPQAEHLRGTTRALWSSFMSRFIKKEIVRLHILFCFRRSRYQVTRECILFFWIALWVSWKLRKCYLQYMCLISKMNARNSCEWLLERLLMNVMTSSCNKWLSLAL